MWVMKIFVYLFIPILFLSASILQELSEPQPIINSVKVEHPTYYCNNYADQGSVVADRSTSVDAMVVSAAYCEFHLSFLFIYV